VSSEFSKYFVSIFKSVVELEGLEVSVFGIFALVTLQLVKSSVLFSVPSYVIRYCSVVHVDILILSQSVNHGGKNEILLKFPFP